MAAYSIQTRDKNAAGKTVVTATITFAGDAYSAGVSVDKQKLGLRTVIEHLLIMDAGGGYATRFVTGDKIMFYEQDPGVPGVTELTEYPGATFSGVVKVVAVGW